MTTKTFAVERAIRIQARREEVFALLSSREDFATWMPVTILEPRVGGNVEFRFDRETGGEIVAFGEITAYDAPSRISFTWDFKDDPLDARTEVTIDLTPDGDATVVRLTHIGFIDDEEAAKHAQGWEHWLGRLKARREGDYHADDRSV